jgi:predicted DCC family thiol-disulfide oxidoreductase YuxK
VDRRERVALLPLADPEAAALLAPIPEDERFASWHLVRTDGRISSRGAAGIELLDALGYPTLSSAVSHVAGPVELLYTLVAEHRDKLGGFVPDGPAARRFP